MATSKTTKPETANPEPSKAQEDPLLLDMQQEMQLLSIQAETLEKNCPTVAAFVKIMSQRHQLASRINHMTKAE